MSETADRATTLRGEPVRYDVRRSDRARKARIDVDLGGITVVVPGGSAIDPESVLAEHAEWVLEADRNLESERDRLPDRRFEPGETFPYLGAPQEIAVEGRPYSVVDDGTFRLAEHHVDETSIQRALETLYRRRARERYEELADHYAPEMGVEYDRIEIRNQQTKWGSCSTTGTLGLNWRLMMAPPEISEYVVIHELAHRREMNHSDAFWEIVERYDPSYREHLAWLDEHSVRLVFSAEDY
jgi:predicted metal-dependent hydrolase